MEVKIMEGPETVITVSGRLDTTTCPEFEEKVRPTLEGAATQVKVDCSGLDYVSSAGLRQFLLLHKKIAGKGGKLTLCGLNPAVREIFNVTGFSAIFRIE